ncbi:MAG: hypothetical protein ACRBBV_07250 [Paracoccaceae bacterium]
MTPIKPLIAAGLLVATPQLAQAQIEWTLGGAVVAAFDTSDGLDHSETTGEIFVEGAINGFHAGLWVGTIYQDPNDDAEIEASLGYGGEVGKIGYDVTLTGYYLNSSNFDHAGLGFEVSYALTDTITGSIFAEIDPDSKDWDRELALEFAVTDKITAWGMIGKSDADANRYGEIGASYALNDFTALEAIYEDADDSAGTLSLIVAFETSFGG